MKVSLAALLLLPGLVAGFTSASAQQPVPAPPLSLIDQHFYATLAEAASRINVEVTKKSGGNGGGTFSEVRPEGGILVGFEVWQGDWSGHRIVRGIRPIFQVATGRVRGHHHGDTGGEPSYTVEAKPDYAVAAIQADGGLRLDGFQVLFWKIRTTMARLDAEGSYKSEWVGGGGGGKSRHPLSSDARPVLGIVGACGTEIDHLALIYAEPK